MPNLSNEIDRDVKRVYECAAHGRHIRRYGEVMSAEQALGYSAPSLFLSNEAADSPWVAAWNAHVVAHGEYWQRDLRASQISEGV